MFSIFTTFRLFDLFRSPPLGGSSAPRVSISDTGLATVTCRPIPAPRVVIDATGLATVSCSNG